jgi:hypothetical protein
MTASTIETRHGVADAPHTGQIKDGDHAAEAGGGAEEGVANMTPLEAISHGDVMPGSYIP